MLTWAVAGEKCKNNLLRLVFRNSNALIFENFEKAGWKNL
jgi:hypothetical protein